MAFLGLIKGFFKTVAAFTPILCMGVSMDRYQVMIWFLAMGVLLLAGPLLADDVMPAPRLHFYMGGGHASDLTRGTVFSAGLEYRPASEIGVGIELSRAQLRTPPCDGQSFGVICDNREDDHLDAVLRFRYSPWHGQRLSPYLLCGVGLSRLHRRHKEPRFLLYSGLALNEADQVFQDPAVPIGAGVDVRLSRRILLFIEWRAMMLFSMPDPAARHDIMAGIRVGF
jgi:hypothetical protein